MSHYVPDEVIAEIFARLPSKSLIRFRSLSKSWWSRIGSSDFIHKHVSLSPKKVIQYQQYVSLVEDMIYVEITGSCDGMLCLSKRSEITLWNPSIGRKLTLPDHSNSSETFGVQEVAIGFGCDPNTNDYKIVKIFHSSKTTKQNSMVYSMNLGVWRPIATPAWLLRCWYHYGGSLVNGVLHWIGWEKQNHRCIVTFDLSTEVFGMITLPGPSCRILTTVNGSLAAISEDKDYSLLWVRKEYNNDSPWSMVHKFEARIRNFLQLSNGNFLFKTSFNHQLVVYNPVTGEQTRRMNTTPYYLAEIVTYAESLALIDKGVPCREYKPSPSSFERLHIG